MLHKIIAAAGLAAIGLLGAPGASAQPFGPGEGGPGPHGRGGPGGLRGMARALDLTDEQRTAVRQVFESQRPEREALREEMQANRTALRESLEDGADPCSVGEIVIEGHAFKERGQALREESKVAFEGLLNEEQKGNLETLQAARELTGPKGRRGMRGPRGGAWGPPEGGPVVE